MAWELAVTMVGSADHPVTLNYKLTGADYAAAAANQTAIETALAAVTDAVITKSRLSEVTETGAAAPTGGIDVAILGTMTGKINGTNKPVTVKFPAPAVRLGTSGDDYNELDLSGGSANLDYWNLFVSGGQATISDGESVSASGPRASQVVSRASRMP